MVGVDSLKKRKKNALHFSLRSLSAADKLINLKSLRILNYFFFAHVCVCQSLNCKIAVDDNDIHVCCGHSRSNDQVFHFNHFREKKKEKKMISLIKFVNFTPTMYEREEENVKKLIEIYSLQIVFKLRWLMFMLMMLYCQLF